MKSNVNIIKQNKIIDEFTCPALPEHLNEKISFITI